MGLSLKDPVRRVPLSERFAPMLMIPVQLTLARLKVPIRSVLCNHVSCFDASTFLMMNEQTPTWKCPICSNVLRYEDLTVDGSVLPRHTTQWHALIRRVCRYLQDILRICPSSVDEVTVEPNGKWRSSDNQHGTAPPRASRAGTEDLLNAAIEKGKAKAVDQDAFTIDSDDDDDPPVIRNRLLQLDNSRPGSRASTEAPKRSETIDLTLSDSEDEQDDVVLYNGHPAAPLAPPPRLPEQMTTPGAVDPYGDVRAQYIEAAMENAAAKRSLDEEESSLPKRQREY